jgi:hypothetical protein
MEEIYKTKNDNLFISNTKFFFKHKLISYKDIKYLFEDFILNLKFYDEESINTKKRREVINKLIIEGKKEDLINLLKNGIPNSIRKNVYSFILNISANEINHIKDETLMLLDHVIQSDVTVKSTNTDSLLYRKLFPISREYYKCIDANDKRERYAI